MYRIPISSPVFNGNEKKYLNECIDTGWVSANGKFVDEFSKKFAEFCGSKYSLPCSNGTVTLHLIAKALGIGPGDEVIMPTLTYIATANAISECGATPVFVDSDINTWNIDPKEVEKAITKNTKAIIPVDLYGLACDMTELMKISEKYNIPIIEDAAEAHGACWNGKKVGSFGKAGSFSFFGNKIITCGEGGMIVTDDEEFYKKMKLLRSQGTDPSYKRYWHICRGYNYRMTNMQAAIGLAQLENIDWHINERKRVVNKYRELLKNELGDYLIEQKVTNKENHIYWMYSIVLSDKVKKSRDEVMRLMEEKGIEMRPLFYPMHIMPPYENKNLHLPVAEYLSSRGINLPTHALMDDEKIEYVVNCLKEIIVE